MKNYIRFEASMMTEHNEASLEISNVSTELVSRVPENVPASVIRILTPFTHG
jgi:hypothetical protein